MLLAPAHRRPGCGRVGRSGAADHTRPAAVCRRGRSRSRRDRAAVAGDAPRRSRRPRRRSHVRSRPGAVARGDASGQHRPGRSSRPGARAGARRGLSRSLAHRLSRSGPGRDGARGEPAGTRGLRATRHTCGSAGGPGSRRGGHRDATLARRCRLRGRPGRGDRRSGGCCSDGWSNRHGGQWRSAPRWSRWPARPAPSRRAATRCAGSGASRVTSSVPRWRSAWQPRSSSRASLHAAEVTLLPRIRLLRASGCATVGRELREGGEPHGGAGGAGPRSVRERHGVPDLGDGAQDAALPRRWSGQRPASGHERPDVPTVVRPVRRRGLHRLVRDAPAPPAARVTRSPTWPTTAPTRSPSGSAGTSDLVVGESYGGMIAQHLAARHGDRVGLGRTGGRCGSGQRLGQGGGRPAGRGPRAGRHAGPSVRRSPSTCCRAPARVGSASSSVRWSSAASSPGRTTRAPTCASSSRRRWRSMRGRRSRGSGCPSCCSAASRTSSFLRTSSTRPCG